MLVALVALSLFVAPAGAGPAPRIPAFLAPPAPIPASDPQGVPGPRSADDAGGTADPQDAPGATATQESAPRGPDRPSRMVGPRRGKERLAALRRFGGDASTENAVEAGLDWLARHQQQDGSFDADAFGELCVGTPCDGVGKGQHGEDVACPFDVAISALATLAFLGQGHLPAPDDVGGKDGDDGERGAGRSDPGAESDTAHGRGASDPYGGVVARALARLRAGRDDDRWALALTTEAFAEAEILEGRGRFRADVEDGARRLLELRQDDGAFGYAAPWREGSDTPYTGLAVCALLAARDAGVRLPEDFAGGIDRFLESLEAKKGRLAYLAEGRRYGYTPTTTNAHIAAALRELLDVRRDGARHRAHLALVRGSLPQWRIRFETVDVKGLGPVRAQIGELSMYQWWYGGIAAFQSGDGLWRPWFQSARKELLAHQQTDGCARGSWNPEGTYERQTGGRVFATALGVLMLEQPYRQRRR